MQLNGKTVWVTGASSGIGEALCEQLAAKGATLVLSARNEEKLNALNTRLGGNHHVVALDLAKPEALLENMPAVIERIGRIDVLINNGGVSQRSLFLENEFTVYRQLMEVNYFGLIALTKAVVPQMVKQGMGMVVSISSVAGKVGSKFRTGYSGSKYAVVGFMDCLRAELADKNVNCLTICPGSIKTAIAHNSLDGQGKPQNRPEQSIENGMDVAKAAAKMIKAIEAEKDEVVIGEGISGLAPTIKRFFPGFFNRLTAKMNYK